MFAFTRPGRAARSTEMDSMAKPWRSSSVASQVINVSNGAASNCTRTPLPSAECRATSYRARPRGRPGPRTPRAPRCRRGSVPLPARISGALHAIQARSAVCASVAFDRRRHRRHATATGCRRTGACTASRDAADATMRCSRACSPTYHARILFIWMPFSRPARTCKWASTPPADRRGGLDFRGEPCCRRTATSAICRPRLGAVTFRSMDCSR